MDAQVWIGSALLAVGLLIGSWALFHRRLRKRRLSEANAAPSTLDEGWQPRGRRAGWQRSERIEVVIGIASIIIGLTQIVQAQSEKHDKPTVQYVDEMPPLEGRAAKPEEIMANGIRLTEPGSYLEFPSLKNVAQRITYEDLNTIVRTTRVPELVDVLVDPLFQPDTTTQRRTQYLANRVGMLPGVVSTRCIATFSQESGQVITVFFVVNGKEQAITLGRTTATFTNRQNGRKLADFAWTWNDPHIVPAATSLMTAILWPDDDAAKVSPDDLLHLNMAINLSHGT